MLTAARGLPAAAGGFNVGMPRATTAGPGAGTGAYQPALCTVDLASVVMSNQIQPPSSKGCSPISNSVTAGVPRSALEASVPPTVMRAPVAFERYTSMRAVPVSSTRRTTDSSVDHRRQ